MTLGKLGAAALLACVRSRLRSDADRSRGHAHSAPPKRAPRAEIPPPVQITPILPKPKAGGAARDL